MAKIIDPTDLTRSSSLANLGVDGNIWIDVATKKISMAVFGLLTTDGASLQAVYSYLKDEWKTDVDLIKFPFPITAITPEQFEFTDTWQPADVTTSDLFRDGGYAIKNGDGSSAEEYIGVITLGTLGGADQVYYQPIDDTTASENVTLTGVVNQCIKVYGDGGGHGIDNGVAYETRSYLSLFVREQAKLYSQASHTDIGVTTFTYQAYRFPLANGDDLKITHTDIEIDSTADGVPDVAPYSDMSITYLDGSGYTDWADGIVYPAGTVVRDTTEQANSSTLGTWWYTTLGGTSSGTGVADDVGVTDWVSFTGERQIGIEWYPFDIVIDADVANDGSLPTAEQIYEFVQFQLRQNLDIDADGVGVVTGKTATSLLRFVGDTLVTSQGVFIDDFSSTDINRIEFYDVAATKRTFPFVAAGAINFNSNLSGDVDAVYKMFFTDANGSNFGDTDAIIVKDNAGTDIAGSVPFHATDATQVQFTFDYDGNIQGGRTAQTDAAITVVALGLNKAQYVKATSTIARTNANSVSLVASLERNYSNPA